MRALTTCFLFVLTGVIGRAQSFSIINDKDGFVNVRKESNPKSAIVGKLYIDDIFGVDEDDTVDITKLEWFKIYKQIDRYHSLEGYIHKSRNFFLFHFPTIKKVKTYADSCVCNNDSLKVVIKSGIFKPRNHKLTNSVVDKTTNTLTELNKIDGHQIWGTDGELPRTAITSLKVTINGSKIDIPKSAFYDLYEPRFSSITVYLGKNNTIYVKMGNSDGAGAYTIIWIIKNGKYLKRYIDNSYI